MDQISALDMTTVEDVIGKATKALLEQSKGDGHWVFELEADATIPSEYVLLVHYLGETPDLTLERKIGHYLRRIQGDHGGWPLFHDGAFNISATVKAYFALKMIGDSVDAPHMVRAREAILAHGGADKANVFTRMQLALFGETAWRNTPTVPAELILLPRWFPVHLSKMSYWARTVIVPLLVLQALKPLARNPRNIHVPELFVPGATTASQRAPHQSAAWSAFFVGLDRVLKVVEPLWPRGLRRRAIARCQEFVVERLNGEDGLGAIYPAMANSVMMFDALGYPEDHPDRAIARQSLEKLLVVKDDEAYCQPCVSPIWDTALACHALMEAKSETADAAVNQALEWLKARQVLDVKGDWAEERPGVRPGGWAFQYNNAHYPDLDDTAVVVMALDRARKTPGADHALAIDRGTEWVVGLQSRNGGWGAFDADNSYHYLNNIPFADHGALLDPPTEDVTGRCIGMLAQLGEPADSPRMKAAVDYLARVQLPDGSWFGRWGVNYIYGTWSALAGLNAVPVDPQSPMIRRAVDWLVSIHNPDGGWGEDCESYKLDYKGYEPAPSTASQTAWALLGLMAAGEVDHPAVARGIAHLKRTQQDDGLWAQQHYTGGGFPRVFYLRYHGYPKIFPLWAVARYRNLKAGNSRHVAYGL
ncbi:squalene--hopene cyclase [Reyranella sp. CPCC 100927]|uniref:squalene--hopene cyclase n=1 Tax=Reyranella sp. CPCC 100927 TaxID=2599616 RepID=UPI0011B4E502|nr:squalene--hopene cyclase [Reyranella sp. CPCC 100927]TWT00730.1 squalene--hopene cyclase [Reyranella sp. CPCC 100927]